MIIQAHLNFFSIDECGLYKRDSDVAKALDTAETFELIYQWVQGKPMKDTIPWDPSGSRPGAPKCYCHDYYKCETTGDYLFVLWKSETDGAGTIWGASAGAQTGKGTVVEYADKHKGEPVIWGRPCYYWIIPSLRTVVSIKLDNSVCDSQMFQDWVAKCITNRVPHDNKNRAETETGRVRFEFSDKTDSSGCKYTYRFNVNLRTLNTGSAELQKLASRVTHIVRRDTIKLNEGLDERNEWVKFFDKIPMLPRKPKSRTRQIEVRAEAKPSAQELKTIIEEFSKENRKRADWDNVGFDTDTGVVWVDRYRLHSTLNFNKEASNVFAAADMHARLNENRLSQLAEIERNEADMKRLQRTATGK